MSGQMFSARGWGMTAPKQLATKSNSDLILRIMHRWYRALAQHRKWVIVVLILSGAILGVASTAIRWQTNILLFFPQSSPEMHSWRAASRLPVIANRFYIDLHCHKVYRHSLPSAAKQLAAKLAKQSVFSSIWAGVSVKHMQASGKILNAELPGLLNKSSFEKLTSHLKPAWLAEHFRQLPTILEAPGGLQQMGHFLRDPLDAEGILDRQLRPTSHPSLHIDRMFSHNGLLSARGGTHILLIATLKFPPSNLRLSKLMLQAVSVAVKKIKSSFPHVHVWTIGAYVDYAANADRIKRDVIWVSTLGSLLVAGVIWFYFRRLGTLFICMLPPSVGLGTALGVAGLLHCQLPLMVLAFSGLILGATTDYGIQILAQYGRLKQEADKTGTSDDPAMDAARAALALFGPITMSAITSVAGYSALAFSNAPGLQAMGLFIAGGTLCIWLLTFLILPAFLGEYCRPRPAGPSFHLPSKIRILLGLAFTLLTILLALHAAKLGYSAHPSQLNGVSTRQARIQRRFFHIWGNSRRHGVVVIASRHAQSALQQSELLAADLGALKRQHLIRGYVSTATFVPSEHVFDRRLRRWSAFWTVARRRMLRHRLQLLARAAGIADNHWIDHAVAAIPTRPSARYRLMHSPMAFFPGVITRSRHYYYLSNTVYPGTRLTPRMASDWVDQIELLFPHALILDGSALVFDAAQRSKAQLEFLFPWIFLAVFLPVCLYFRRIDVAVIAALSLVVGFIWLSGVAQWWGGGLNFLALVPMLFTMGVAIDYGIYTASDPNLAHPDRRPRTVTTGICALTTILGSGAIIAASHPALHWIGLTLVAGIAGGYAAALFWVAPLMRLLHWASAPSRGRRFRRAMVRVGFGTIAVLGAASALLLTIVCMGQLIMTSERPRGTVHLPEHRVVRQVSQSTWRIGRAWMRRIGGIWVMSVGGSSGHVGYDDGALGAPIDTQIENDMLDQLHHFVPSLWAQWVITRGVALDMLQLPHYIPGYIQREAWAESVSHPDIHGFLGPTYARLLSYEALDDISQNLIDNPLIDAHAVGCTGVVARPAWSGDGCLWLARNFDFEGGPAFNQQKSITFVRPRRGYPFVTVAWPGLSGCVTGFNGQKIGLFINAAATRGFKPIGEPTIIVARQVLQFARNLKEAIAIFQKADVFVADSIVVGDGKTGRAVIIEKSPLHCAVIPVRKYAAVTNQFTAPVFRHDPVNRQRIAASTSRFRLARATKLIRAMRGHVSAVGLARLLRDKASVNGRFIGYGNRNAIDALITAHSVVMDLTRGRLWVAAWPYAEGAYLGVRVYPMLKRHPPPLKQCLLASIPADHFLTSGAWRKFKAARRALHAGYRKLHTGHFRAALRFAASAKRNDPDFFSSYELAGRAYLALGNTKLATDQLSRALALDPPYQARRKELRHLLALMHTGSKPKN